MGGKANGQDDLDRGLIAALPGMVSVGNVTVRYDLLVEDLARVGSISSTETFTYLDAVNKWTELA
ncbi:MAG: hypothetical protein JRC92_03440 [Deltaproteobacteria bacterium]|nr:hypothetical protein [Deltaproteobacteria bacterium]